MSRTIFKNTVLIFSKVFDKPPVSSSVRLSHTNSMLINTMPSILFSTNAPKILLGNMRITVPYRLESPVVGVNASTSPS